MDNDNLMALKYPIRVGVRGTKTGVLKENH